MMKDEEVLATKSLWMLALVLCLCLGAASAAGAEADALARDITGQCLFNVACNSSRGTFSSVRHGVSRSSE